MAKILSTDRFSIEIWKNDRGDDTKFASIVRWNSKGDRLPETEFKVGSVKDVIKFVSTIAALLGHRLEVVK